MTPRPISCPRCRAHSLPPPSAAATRVSCTSCGANLVVHARVARTSLYLGGTVLLITVLAAVGRWWLPLALLGPMAALRGGGLQHWLLAYHPGDEADLPRPRDKPLLPRATAHRRAGRPTTRTRR